MSYQSQIPRPHVSRAILHLRKSVAVVSLVLALCLVGQVLGWAISHFTDVRFVDLTAEAAIEAAPTDPVVVISEAPKTGESLVGLDAAEEGVGVNRVGSRGAEMLRGFLGLTQTVGIVMSVALMVLMLQGVSVAAGASVPGVEMAVTATTWAIIVTVLCLPLSTLLPEAKYPGVFVSYQTIADACDAYRDGVPGAPGFFGFWGRFAVMPLLLVIGLTALVLRFRAGVNAGVIITNVSELDERLEREIRARRVGELNSPRAVGALNQALGDMGLSAPPPPPLYESPLKPTGTDPGQSGSQRRIRPI